MACGGQAEFGEQRGGIVALKRDVVDGEHRAWSRQSVIDEIGRRERRLPVVAMRDLGRKTCRRAICDVGPGARQRGEALRVVRPVAAVRPEIGVADPRIEMIGDENEHIEPGGAGGDDARRPAKQIRVFVDCLGALELGRHCRITRQQRAHFDAFARQRRRQRARHVGEAASLYQRVGF